MVASHANSLRSIIMYLDKLATREVTSLELSTGIPLLYIYKEGEFLRRVSPVGSKEAGVYAYSKKMQLNRSLYFATCRVLLFTRRHWMRCFSNTCRKLHIYILEYFGGTMGRLHSYGEVSHFALPAAVPFVSSGQGCRRSKALSPLFNPICSVGPIASTICHLLWFGSSLAAYCFISRASSSSLFWLPVPSKSR
ncbi:phosphoglycerate mutase [Gossypium australe]|uniref:Phosphoglycerate mutase n=1 Tax=Gossypium australe TaxID=47621 RepID=A0A5B6UKI8_9ROSI|nr:phosphoglycerate mutase [Gossypium australe]